jgi:nitrite reductase (NADH) small subunit
MGEYLVGVVDDIPEGGRKVVACDDAEIGIFKVDGEFYAWHNACAHRGGPVCQGRIFPRVEEAVAEDGTTRMLSYSATVKNIACPWHGYEFNIKTGRHTGASQLRLKRANLKVVGSELYVVL